jgi:hypothetical protein
MKLLFVISCLTGYALDAILLPAASSNTPPVAPETYRYTSAPGARLDERGKETIIMSYSSAAGLVRLSSQTLSRDSLQTVTITLTPQGDVVAASLESATSLGGEVIQRSRIRKEDGTVYVDVSHGQTSNTQSIRIPDGKKLAVDASLLHLMRQFPFGTGEEWHVFMVDFSGESVTVSVRNQGTEFVTVPAGAFPCYRMEVRVGIAFLKATITYWLTKNPPHFLVKHRGKKGPFTRTYTTVLDSIDSTLQATEQLD